GEDRGEKPPLLLVSSARDEGRPRVVDADPVDELWRPRAGQLLVEDRLLGRPRAPPAVLARPEETDVPRGMEPALPVAEEGELLGQRGVVVRYALGSRGPMCGEPGAHLPAEALVGGREGEVHRRPLLSITSAAIASEAGGRHEAGTMRFGLATPVVTC